MGIYAAIRYTVIEGNKGIHGGILQIIFLDRQGFSIFDLKSKNISQNLTIQKNIIYQGNCKYLNLTTRRLMLFSKFSYLIKRLVDNQDTDR